MENINVDNLFIVSARGGYWEDSWYYDHVIVGRDNADKAFDEAVKCSDRTEADWITLQAAYIAENGVIRAKDGEFLREWQQ